MKRSVQITSESGCNFRYTTIRKWRIFLMFSLLLCLKLSAICQTSLRLPAFSDQYLDVSTEDYFSAFFDSIGQMSVKEAQTEAFVPLEIFKYPKGILRNNDCRIWLRCKTDSLTCKHVDSTKLFWHFNLRQSMIEGYKVTANGEIKHYEWGQSEDGKPLSTQFLLPFDQSAGPVATWYFRIRPFPFRINDFSPRVMSLKGWRDRSAARYYDMRMAHNITVCLTGIILFIALFTFIQWALYWRRIYFYFGCFLLMSIANLYRYEMEFALPVTRITAFLTTHGDYITVYLGHAFYFLFVNKFLSLRWRMPSLYRLSKVTAYFCFLLFILHLLVYFVFNRHDWSLQIYLIRFPLLSIGFYSLFAILFRRPPFYVFIFCGGISLAIGALIWMISGYRIERELSGFANANVAFYIGVMLETLFFLSGLGYQFKISEESKRKAQKKVLLERERITRDLHDDVGSTLNSLAVMSELAIRQSEHLPVQVLSTLETIQNTARDTVQRISDIVWSINPKFETVGDLIARMRNFTFLLFSGTDTRIRFVVPDSLESLPIVADRRWQLYLIFKEAANNVSKYAAASLLCIEFEQRDGKLRLTLCDNGKGFDPAQVLPGNGLRTMQERAKALGGTVQLRSKPGEGTVVEIYWDL